MTSTNAPVIYPHLTSPATRRLWTQSRTIALASSDTYTYNWGKRPESSAWPGNPTAPFADPLHHRRSHDQDGLVEYAVSPL